MAQSLAGELSGRRGIQLSLVSDRSHFLFTPLWSAVASGQSALTQVAIPIRSLVDHTEVVLDRVRRIDLDARCIVGERVRLDFDFLVVAPGSQTDWGAHPEFEHVALPCRSGRDAVDAHDAVDRAFEAAAGVTDSDLQRRLLTFVIVGAGATGVELAAHLASRLEALIVDGVHGDLPLAARVVLIEREREVLPQFGEELRRIALTHLQNAGVELELGRSVVGCSPERVELHTQDAIGCGTIFWCGGVRPGRWLGESGFETDEIGRVLVHQSLQAVGQHGVYVLGDAAGVPQGGPMTADVAVQQADTVTRNIIADLSGRSRRDWVYEAGGTFISLGQTNAIADYRGVVLVGRAAQALWGATTTRLLPGGVRGLALVPDLFAGAFAARGNPQRRGLLES